MQLRLLYIVMLLVSLILPEMKAQDSKQSDLDNSYMSVESRVLLYREELASLYQLTKLQLTVDYDRPMSKTMIHSLNERINSSDATLQAFATKWNTFSQYQLANIAQNDEILEQVTLIQQMQQEITDSIQVRRQLLDNIVAFSKAEAFVFSRDSTYRRLYNQAMPLSLVKQSAPLLEKLKSSEQLLFTQVQDQYTQAKTIAENIPKLSRRMSNLESKFVELKTVSAKIQEAAYKPLFDRVKDYLMSLAAVAILLMFVNMVVSRINSIKALRKQAKDLQNMVQGGNKDFFPTI